MNTQPPMSRSLRQSNLSPSAILPDDLIIEIMSWLTVKSLMKMKCVSKSFPTIISDPKFIKLHLNRSSQNSFSYVVSYNSTNLEDDAYSFITFSFSSLLENRSINLPNDPYYNLIDKDCCQVVGSCNGLVCMLGYSYNRNSHRETWLRLWNPATRTISNTLGYLSDDYRLKFWRFVFGYDNSTETYKVVALHNGGDTITEVRVLTIGNNVWRNIQSVSGRLHLFFYRSIRRFVGGVHLNCTVNWLAFIEIDNLVSQFVIISLDLSTETHTQLLGPPGTEKISYVMPMPLIFVLMDFLCFYHDINGTELVIWKMTKFRDEKSWTQFLKISYQNLQLDNMGDDSSCVHLYENGDTLVFTEYFHDQTILYNLKNSTTVKIRLNKICWFSINNYVESLVSTC